MTRVAAAYCITLKLENRIPILTNPAKELYALCLNFRSTDRRSSAEVISDLLKVKQDSSVFFGAITAISGRFELVHSLIDIAPYMPEEQKARTKQSVEHMGRFFSTTRFSIAWAENVKAFLQDEHLIRLEHTESLIQIVAPIHIPDDKEREEFIKEIENAIILIKDKSDIYSTTLVSNLMSIQFILERLGFFGIEKLSEILSVAYLAVSTELRSENLNSRSSSWKKGLKMAGAVIGAIVSSLVVIDKTTGAIENLYSRTQILIEYLSSKENPEVKLLPPPPADVATGSDKKSTS